VSQEEVAKHSKDGDCWLVIDGVVYDVSNYLVSHPGGLEAILKHGGRDATAPFNGEQHPMSVHTVVKEYRIGTVRGQDSGGSSTEPSKKTQ
jgi:L-lactate dehydrogenase (cytochrome)